MFWHFHPPVFANYSDTKGIDHLPENKNSSSPDAGGDARLLFLLARLESQVRQTEKETFLRRAAAQTTNVQTFLTEWFFWDLISKSP